MMLVCVRNNTRSITRTKKEVRDAVGRGGDLSVGTTTDDRTLVSRGSDQKRRVTDEYSGHRKCFHLSQMN